MIVSRREIQTDLGISSKKDGQKPEFFFLRI